MSDIRISSNGVAELRFELSGDAVPEDTKTAATLNKSLDRYADAAADTRLATPLTPGMLQGLALIVKATDGDKRFTAQNKRAASLLGDASIVVADSGPADARGIALRSRSKLASRNNLGANAVATDA